MNGEIGSESLEGSIAMFDGEEGSATFDGDYVVANGEGVSVTQIAAEMVNGEAVSSFQSELFVVVTVAVVSGAILSAGVEVIGAPVGVIFHSSCEWSACNCNSRGQQYCD